jgi:hypothetical protein
MRGVALLFAAIALLPACGRQDDGATAASVQAGIDRSVADVRAAQAAASGPVVLSKSVGEAMPGRKTDPKVATLERKAAEARADAADAAQAAPAPAPAAAADAAAPVAGAPAAEPAQ